MDSVFFACRADELPGVFPDWLPVADAQEVSEVRNPATGRVQAVRRWVPAGPAPAGKAAGAVAVRQLPHADLKGCDPVKLSRLLQCLTGDGTAAVEFDRPALLPPARAGGFLYRLPDPFVAAVAAVTAPRAVARKWVKTEECRLDKWGEPDAVEVVTRLGGLARLAAGDGTGVFVWYAGA